MIVRSTHAAHLIPKAAVPSAGRQPRQCSIHSVGVLLRSNNLATCRDRSAVRVAAQRAVYAGQAQPRFAKQLGLLKKQDTAQKTTSVDKDKPYQPRFAKQLGLLKEDKHDEQQEEQPQEEQPEVKQIDIEESAPAPSSSQPEQYEDDQQEEQPEVEHIGAEESEPEPSTSQPEQEDLGLVPNKEGYQVIELEGCDFLLATTADGSFDLSDAYVQDDESGIYAEPDVTSGELPATAQQYAQIEWQEEFLGDIVYDKPPKFLVKRVYLVHITQLEPRRLDLENVWVLDGESRSIYKAQVDRITDSQDPAEIILRIRRDGSLLIDNAEDMPTPDELILEIEFGEGADGQPSDSPQRWRMDDPDDDLNDPIDAMGDDFDEPDVPPVDLA